TNSPELEEAAVAPWRGWGSRIDEGVALSRAGGLIATAAEREPVCHPLEKVPLTARTTSHPTNPISTARPIRPCRPALLMARHHPVNRSPESPAREAFRFLSCGRWDCWEGRIACTQPRRCDIRAFSDPAGRGPVPARATPTCRSASPTTPGPPSLGGLDPRSRAADPGHLPARQRDLRPGRQLP